MLNAAGRLVTSVHVTLGGALRIRNIPPKIPHVSSRYQNHDQDLLSAQLQVYIHNPKNPNNGVNESSPDHATWRC